MRAVSRAGWLAGWIAGCMVGVALPPPLRAQGFAVSGRVVDALSGTALARATVNIEPLAAGSARGEEGRPGRPGRATALGAVTTGSDGGFQFGSLPAGRYVLRASRRGYLSASFEEHEGFFAAVIVGQGAAPATGLRFPLLPYASINGSLQDSSGDPVENATVSLFVRGEDGTGSVRPRGTTSPERGGSGFEFANLPPGTYYVAVAARPWFAESSDGEGTHDPLDVAYPVTFFDSAEDAAGAEPIVLKAGEVAQVSFSLHAVPAVHVQVPLQEGGLQSPALSTAAFGTSIPLEASGARYAGSGRPGDGGTLNLSVAPGTYTLRLGGEARTIHASADLPITPAAGGAPVALGGRLAMADGSALPQGAVLRLVPVGGVRGGFRGGFAQQRGGDQGAFFGARPLELVTGGDGSFHTDALAPGDYQLAVGGSMVVTGAAASGAEVSEELMLHVGADPVVLAVTAAQASGSVSGQTVSAEGKPESGVMVLLVPQDGSGALYREDESDSDGSWTMDGVVPGPYRAVAIRDGWDLAWKKPGVVARYLAQGGVPVTVSAHGATVMPGVLPVQQR